MKSNFALAVERRKRHGYVRPVGNSLPAASCWYTVDDRGSWGRLLGVGILLSEYLTDFVAAPDSHHTAHSTIILSWTSLPTTTQLVLKMHFSTILVSTALFLASGSHAWTNGVANNRFYTIRGSE